MEVADAWWELVKRWDLVVAGRNRALLKTIISPDRCKLEGPAGVIWKWEASMSKHESRKDEKERSSSCTVI